MHVRCAALLKLNQRMTKNLLYTICAGIEYHWIFLFHPKSNLKHLFLKPFHTSVQYSQKDNVNKPKESKDLSR